MELEGLLLSTSIIMQKTKPGFAGGMFTSNYKETVCRFLSDSGALSVMNNIKGIPAYRKQFFLDILSMVKQLGRLI